MHLFPRRFARRFRQRRLARLADASKNILTNARMLSFQDSAQYYLDHMTFVASFGSKWQLIDFALNRLDQPGLILEFGVAKGGSINYIAARTERTIYGFDSFEGLPERWTTGREAGRFKVAQIPKVPPHVQLVAGWFDQTLAPFLREHPEPVALLHVDSDLYSSAKTIFDQLEGRLRPGTLILFDEYFNYPGWRQHEYKAFQEFVARTGVKYEYLAFAAAGEQVLCRVL